MIKPKDYWVVEGCSWAGKTTKRNGKVVSCGHKHKSHRTAQPCAAKMRKARPGNCQDYRPKNIVFFAVTRRPKMSRVTLEGMIKL